MMLIRFGMLILAIVVATQAPTLAQKKTAEKKSFSVVLLPDTQFYSQKYPETYVAQTMWIRKRVKEDNIKFAVHLGDIVQTPTKKAEWENAHRAMLLLDGVVPYSMVPGNHDMVVKSRDSSLYNEFFSPTRFADTSWYGGHMGKTNDNNFCTFEAGGMKFMVVSLEFAPRDEALQWAAGVINDHPAHRVIVARTATCVPTGATSQPPSRTRLPATVSNRCGRS